MPSLIPEDDAKRIALEVSDEIRRIAERIAARHPDCTSGDEAQRLVSDAMELDRRAREERLEKEVQRLNQRLSQAEQVIGYALTCRTHNTAGWMLAFSRRLTIYGPQEVAFDGDRLVTSEGKRKDVK